MKEVGIIKKIYKGFFPDETVSQERMAFRREQCNSCEFNSANVAAAELSSFDSFRKNIGKNFCTLCKCQIEEKTQSPYEECAMYLKDKPKKWFKTRLETSKKEDMNLTNISDKEIDIRLENEVFVVDLGSVRTTEDTEITLLVDTDATENFQIKDVGVSCGCLLNKFSNENNQGKIDLRVDLSTISSGRFVKQMHIRYTLGITKHVQVVTIKGYKS